jgi:hypothetical protein
MVTEYYGTVEPADLVTEPVSCKARYSLVSCHGSSTNVLLAAESSSWVHALFPLLQVNWPIVLHSGLLRQYPAHHLAT